MKYFYKQRTHSIYAVAPTDGDAGGVCSIRRGESQHMLPCLSRLEFRLRSQQRDPPPPPPLPPSLAPRDPPSALTSVFISGCMGDTQYHFKIRCSGTGMGGTGVRHTRDHYGAPAVLMVRVIAYVLNNAHTLTMEW